MNEGSVAIAALTLAGTIFAGFMSMSRQHSKTVNKLTKSLDNVATTNEKIAQETTKVAVATTKSAEQSEKRNGHIAELIIESRDKILLSHQHLDKQEVETQIINKSRKKT